jgi:iron complex outermembrane recepter protein
VHRFNSSVASLLRRGLALAAFCCVLGTASGGEAWEQKRSYNLPRGDASTTLNQFAAASERPVIFMVAKVRGVQTNALAGEFSPAQALERMLMNTELRAIMEPDSGAFVVTRKETGSDGPLAKVGPQPNPENDQQMKKPHVLRRVVAALSLLAALQTEAQTSATPPATDETLMLSPFTVHSESDVGYYASNASSATRINKAVIDLPLPLNVITSEFMADLNAFTLDEAIKYTGGVSSTGFNENTFAIRGFTAGTNFRDGVGIPGGGFDTPRSLVDRVEVMKGPSALLYGQGTAGGVVNTITKQPNGALKHSLKVFYGSHDTRRAEYDFSGVVPGWKSKNWKLNYRVTGQYHRGDTHLFNQHIVEDVVNPMLKLVYRNTTSLMLQYSYQHHINYGHPEAVAALAVVPLTDPRFAGIINVAELQQRIPADVFSRLRASPSYANVPHSYNPEPANAQMRKMNKVTTATFEHSFTPQISLRSVGIYWDHRNFNYQRVGSIETAAQPGFITQQGALRWITQRSATVQTDLSARLERGSIKNQLVLGHLWQKQTERFELFRDTDLRFPISRAPIYPDDFFLGNYASILNGTAVWNGTTTNNNLTNSDFNFFVQNQLTSLERQSAYVIDMVEFFHGRLAVLGGMRMENLEAKTSTRQRGPSYLGSTVLTSGSTNPPRRNLGQYAVIYKLIPSVGIYGAYSESYQPNGAFPNDPQEGTGYDYGMKFSFLNGRLSGRASYFDISLTNVQRADLSNPDPASRSIAVLTRGEKSKGFEADVFYAPNDNLRFIGSWANIDSMVVDNPESPDLNGQPLVDTPRTQISLFGTYTLTQGALKGLRIGTGMVYRGKARSFSTGDRRFLFDPETTRYDAFIDYRQKFSGRRAISYRFNVKNLSGDIVVLHNKWGPGREWQLSVGYDF